MKIQDCQSLLPCHGTRHEIVRLGSLSLKPHERDEPWKPFSGSSESNRQVKIDSTIKKPVLPDVQGMPPK